MAALDRLDKIVEDELSKISLKDTVKVKFNRGFPGHGDFEIRTKVGDIEIVYYHDSESQRLILRDSEDVIQIEGDYDRAYNVSVNDREYCHSCPNCHPDECQQEREEDTMTALKFGAEKLREVRLYLRETVPEVWRLLDSYFSRALLPGGDQLSMRPNSEIFDKFDLKAKKT